MRIVSWNLFYRTGADAADVVGLIEQVRPDLLLMQEVTAGYHTLPEEVGGRFYKAPWTGKSYSLAAWVPSGSEYHPRQIKLPASRLPGAFPTRVAQVFDMGRFSVANVHLSHGQWLNRRQLREIANAIEGPLAIIGDFNSVGPTLLAGFKDAGPRAVTHRAQRIVPLRLDRCVLRELECVRTRALDRGPSDHRPILVELRERTSLERHIAARLSAHS